MGADVIKVESHRASDNLRLSGRTKPVPSIWKVRLFRLAQHQQESIAINMGRPEARADRQAAAAKCSVVTNNFRPEIMEPGGWATRSFGRRSS